VAAGGIQSPRTPHPAWPKPVSPRYRLDWQYVLSTGRLPAFKPVALVLAAMPLLNDFSAVVPIKTEHFWLLWFASVTSLLAFVITFFRCPQIIREYEKYEDYEKVGHTHRWLGWLFYHNLGIYQDSNKLMRELIDKEIAVPAELSLDSSVFASCPMFETGYPVSPPINSNRDLLIGFSYGGRRFVIPIQEDDPKLAAKQKELFWIIYTNLTSSRTLWRLLIWGLYTVSATFTAIAVLLSVIQPLSQIITAKHDFVHRLLSLIGGLCH
jgi:hypothetical protein